MDEESHSAVGLALRRALTTRELQTMLQSKKPGDVLLRIAQIDGGFQKLLEELGNDVKTLELTIKVIQYALSDHKNSQRQAVIDVLHMVMNASQFHDRILQSLTGRLGDNAKYIQDLLVILKMLLEAFPNNALKTFSFLFTHLEQAVNLKFPALVEEKDEVKEIFLRPIRNIGTEEEETGQGGGAVAQQDQEVDPNLFRGLSIIPLAEDFDPAQSIAVRANKIQGRYQNVNDYLDMQFRLLRADLLIPLRENIHNFLNGDAKKGIRAYSQVRIVRPVCHDNGLCFRLSFDVSKFRRVNWSFSQRLKYGSLLCLSSDNFQTYKCAIVENREPKDLAKGLVDVQFILPRQGPDVDVGGHMEFVRLIDEARDQRFVMVESPTYFEAYKYVLLGLQQFTENNFPFWDYIGECVTDINPPQYLAGERKLYQLQPLVDKSFIIKDERDRNVNFSREAQTAANIDVLDLESWPKANTFGLDQSQFLALQSALTKEFSLIQGPPGTGKTFIGLMAMKALLYNKDIWTEDEDPKPILLVCYTNHALDQFLEGILDFYKGKLVRVGSRSKSERLEECNLRGMRHRARENRMVPLDVHLAKRQTHTQMNDLKADIHKEAAKLEILEREIVKESFLKKFIHPRHYQQLTARSSRENVLPGWLGILEDIHKLETKEKDNGQKNKNRNQLEETEEDEEIDNDLVEIVAGEQPEDQLDVDEDDEEDDDLFAELQANLGEEFAEAFKNTSKKLDEADKEAARIKIENTAFNISNFGDEPTPPNLSKKEKAYWKSLIPLKKRYRSILLGHLQKTDRMTQEEAENLVNIWKISRKNKWRLYRYWIDLYSKEIREGIRENSEMYEQKARRYQEILHQEDKAILEKATIIGMTTTAAAKYQGILREIGPKIVLVEEAAEVFEGHVITSLTDQCQHVILIGDHKQLRPNPSVYKLKQKFHIDISLFERLIMNKFPYDCLRYQHRMRPEISTLLKIPDLYLDLCDHEVVKTYPHILKIKGDIAFIQHYAPDEQENDTKTFKNSYEAELLIGLCEYLLQQGYTSKQITILSPYAGQIHHIKTLLETMPKSQTTASKMKGLKISSVDNYQGEENDIILLSLVRSNVDNDIGFLKANNRICVALSRAKMGLYVVGNFIGLAESSPLMNEILKKADKLEYLKDHIVLTCLRHRGKETIIRHPSDFKNVPEGGCRQACGVRLDCGHSCKRICHADDLDHKVNKCNEKCKQVCDKCNQSCKGAHKCGEHDVCRLPVDKRIPICNHIQKVPCYLEPNQFECLAQCGETLSCGHPCREKCGQLHDHSDEICKEKIEIVPKSCGHGKFRTECWKRTEDDFYLCPQPCQTVLECEHVCQGTCGKCLNGRLHLNCQQKCQKILICGHECKDKCNSCPPCSQPCDVACVHSRCPKKCGELCVPCVETCSSGCVHQECDEDCFKPCPHPPCDSPCLKTLPCKHKCPGLCGEKCPRLCVICNKQELIDTSLYGYDGDSSTTFIELDCGHVQEVDFMDQWMVTSTTSSGDQQAIGLKACPVCKTPIRKCNRYNAQIKKMLILIEKVKRKCIGEKLRDMKEQLEREVAKSRGEEKQIIETFLEEGYEVASETIIEAEINQIIIFKQIFALQREAMECKGRWQNKAQSFDQIYQDLQCFEDWILSRRAVFSEQNKEDAELEINRLNLLINLHKIDQNAKIRGIQLNDSERKLQNCIRVLSMQGRADKRTIKTSQDLCTELKKQVPDTQLTLTNEERLAIIRAVNVSAGAWYHCPNGHIYAIGDCGQAMEESRCPDCKEKIGGTNHRLLPTNAWAQHMDNAQQPIWRNVERDRQLAERLQRQQFI
ncbi:NFX1-type zinc finger-containing protein 1 [Biomphalaria glabrata]|uniref:NFX1-type zinc finger-containing protein 1-like n=1 Tax=Biomphalaria glabrata TaxID=6526 RepID=A0A9U8EFH7_BIOGL|nr:NFX1-type zinc finger-containing protein 1-like [Biomphalaria glabrata]XP_055895108.1 NFX1-type zinc finger-containing protein 1-like [Biomphalaria glabrata]KAI8757150.1 NFX1-type zinc finger-containing protein 1-like [Biomphalaria glabrata]